MGEGKPGWTRAAESHDRVDGARPGGAGRGGGRRGERRRDGRRDRRGTERRTPNPDRRAVIRSLGGAGVGMAALGVPVVGRVRGADPDGVPLVWTRRPDGTPERGRRVSPERRRRLRAYSDLDVTGLVREYDALHGVSLTHGRGGENGWTGERSGTAGERSGAAGDGDGLALALLVDRASRAARRSLPDELHGVPTAVVEWTGGGRAIGTNGGRPSGRLGWTEGRHALRRGEGALSTRTCADRILTFHEPIVGGVPVHPRQGDDRLTDGTVGVVCWDAEDEGVCLLTAAHVVHDDEGELYEELYHDGMDDDEEYRDELVGRHAAHSTSGDGGLDVAKYRCPDGTSAGPLASVGHEQPDVTGIWDFAGLADATAEGTVKVCFAGRSTCYAESECVGTFRSDLVDYAVRVRPAIAVAGDSGGAFLDPRGRLVGLFTHYRPAENSGPVGAAALDRVGAKLSPMG